MIVDAFSQMCYDKQSLDKIACPTSIGGNSIF